MMKHHTAASESVAATRRNRMPYRSSSTAGRDLEVVAGGGMVAAGGESEGSNSGVRETKGVVVVVGREDPRTRASGAKYTKHG